ncbi:clavesin-2-like [Lucilia cuprina]|uniref:clavesin-2-like n=1 Tax=Lucilia cuprina TaxID=7375 RepID=UPI001F05CCAB|nr:clavesin-2-like [Lucilia cuprina]XP_046802202.1 clavesin-2-like [Lucilia cuprina]
MSEYLEIALNKTLHANYNNFKYFQNQDNNRKKQEGNHQQILETLRKAIESSLNLALKDKSICFDDNFLYRFLYARKFNYKAAMDLLINYLKNKKNDMIWQNINVFDQKIQHALLDGNPGILTERDRRGRQVITFTAANWNTSKYSLEDIYRALLLTLDTLLEDIQNQALGFVIIVDWTNFSYKQSTHLSPKILKNIIEGLQEFMPVRFKGIHFIAQPWYVEFTLTAIKPFFKEKIKKRIFVHGLNLSSMHNLICKDILPPELGGEAPNVNHFDWFNFLIVCSQSDIPKEYRIMKTIVYTKSPICLKDNM